MGSKNGRNTVADAKMIGWFIIGRRLALPRVFLPVVFTDPLGFEGHFPISFFTRSITSGGWATTSFANF